MLFWLTMTTLLVHREVRPGDSALREIPVAHVVKLFFMQRQPEDSTPLLGIYSGKTCLGHLRLKPQIDEHTQNHNLSFSGDLQLSMLGGKKDRIGWEGQWEMDKLLATRRFTLTVKTHSPTDLTSQIEVIPAENIAHYELLGSNGTLERGDYPLDESGVRMVLNQLVDGDSSLLTMFEKQRAAMVPTIKARLSSLPVLHGESMDTYLITIDVNGQNLLNCHVDQLGRVIYVTTLLGYTLSTDVMSP